MRSYGGLLEPTNAPQSKYWGDVSPLSHRDRRPCHVEKFGDAILTSAKVTRFNTLNFAPIFQFLLFLHIFVLGHQNFWT